MSSLTSSAEIGSQGVDLAVLSNSLIFGLLTGCYHDIRSQRQGQIIGVGVFSFPQKCM